MAPENDANAVSAASSTALAGARQRVDGISDSTPHTLVTRADLSPFEQELLGDLFAIVEEHADHAALPIDRGRVEEAFVYACVHHADQRRKSGEDFIAHPVGVAKICAGMRLDTETLCAALLHDTVEDTSASLEEVSAAFGEEIAGARRRCDQAHGADVPVARRGAGRELPQDGGRDVDRHPRDPDQARRSPAQHAHDLGDAQAEADREVARDARHLRADRPPARYPRDQVGARGPGVPDAAPAQVQRDQGPGRPAARRARALRQRGRRVPGRRADGARDPRRDLGPRQALLLDLLEDDQEGARVQRDLRPDRDARDRRLGQGHVWRRGRDPLAVEAAPRPLQGLHRDAEVQHVPVAAHDRDRSRGQAARDPDQDPRDARSGRIRDRRALDVQSRPPRRRYRPASATPTASSSGCARCSTGSRTSAATRRSSWRP